MGELGLEEVPVKDFLFQRRSVPIKVDNGRGSWVLLGVRVRAVPGACRRVCRGLLQLLSASSELEVLRNWRINVEWIGALVPRSVVDPDKSSIGVLSLARWLWLCYVIMLSSDLVAFSRSIELLYLG